MKSSFIAKFLTTAACASLVATPAMAEKADRLTTLNGLQADGAESALRSRGFTFIDSHRNSMGYVYSYWWDHQDENCVQVEVYRNTVETIQDAQNSDCNQSNGGGNTAAAVGAVAGLAILGGLLASRSHHRGDNEYSDQDQRRFDNGYQDGLHNAAYHNKHDSDAYARGYEAGVDERNANMGTHHNRGGYVQTVDFHDLEGARAAGAMDEMERRGFQQVDNFTSGNTRYSIQWRRASSQCVQMTIADGHIYDMRDIGQHPECR
jgi:hypothetical protein